jgi:hypothetical protein
LREYKANQRGAVCDNCVSEFIRWELSDRSESYFSAGFFFVMTRRSRQRKINRIAPSMEKSSSS